MKKSEPNQKEIKQISIFTKKNRRKNLKQSLQDYRWLMWALGVLFVIWLGYSGFREYFLSIHERYSPWDILYRTLQLFVLESGSLIPPINLKLELARWLAPAISVIAAANVLIAIFREQYQLFKIRFLRRHIILCGLGNKGLRLSLKFKDYGKKVVVIELNEENDSIIECRNKGIIVLTGNAMVPNILRRAGLKKARYLFSVCGQDNINAKITFLARELLTGKKSKPLTCVVHITDPQFCRLIKEREFETEENHASRLEFLNLFDQAAKALINFFPPFAGRKEPRSLPPHLLIVGAGSMGESLVVHWAKKWSELADKTHKKFKISIIDKSAEKKQKLFYLRYPGLKKTCEIIPLEMDIDSAQFEEGKFLFSTRGECNLTIIYICLNNESFALSTALTLHQRLRKHDIPIVVRMNSETGLSDLIKGEAHGLGRLHGFGLLDRVLDPKILLLGTHEILAQAIHEEYLKDQLAKGETPESNSSVVPWDELPEILKESSRRQADFLGVKLKEIDCYIIPMTEWNPKLIEFTTEEIEWMSKKEHDHWLEERLKDGWKYAPGKKNTRKKRSPFLIPWDELSEEEKNKDRNFVRKMPVFLAKAGFQIYRREKQLQKI